MQYPHCCATPRPPSPRETPAFRILDDLYIRLDAGRGYLLPSRTLSSSYLYNSIGLEGQGALAWRVWWVGMGGGEPMTLGNFALSISHP